MDTSPRRTVARRGAGSNQLGRLPSQCNGVGRPSSSRRSFQSDASASASTPRSGRVASESAAKTSTGARVVGSGLRLAGSLTVRPLNTACGRGAAEIPAIAGKNNRVDPRSPEWLQTLVREFGNQACDIPDTALRGITVAQLTGVIEFAQFHCWSWFDTAPPQFSTTAGRQLDMSFLNLYHMSEWVIKPVTKNVQCGEGTTSSFVELVARGHQSPRWFVSHWWGEPVEDFLKCLGLHSHLHRLCHRSDPFWVCAYANRQHSLQQELVRNPEETSFFRAMKLSHGVLLIVDAASKVTCTGPGVVFSRAWCQFEQAKTFEIGADEAFALDIATTCNGKAEMLSYGPTEDDATHMSQNWQKAVRERTFPIEIIRAGLGAMLEKSEAACDEDRVRILNSIARRPSEELDYVPLIAHEAYARTDLRLHALLAVAAWRQAVDKGLIQKLGLARALAADVWRSHLILNLTSCDELTTTDELGQGISGLVALKSITLYMDACKSLTNVAKLGKGIGQLVALMEAKLCFNGCVGLSNVADLGRGIGRLSSLTVLTLDLEGTSIESVKELGEGIGHLPRLTHLSLSLRFCRRLVTIAEFGRAMRRLSFLSHLWLDFHGCERLPHLVQRVFGSVRDLESVL